VTRSAAWKTSGSLTCRLSYPAGRICALIRDGSVRCGMRWRRRARRLCRLSKASEAELIGDSAGYSVIRLHRRRGFYQDSLRAYRVRIDGNPLGKIAKGETRDFIVPPGEHRVRLTIDRLAGSREVMLQVREGELVEFTCRPGHPALALWWPLPLLFIVFPVNPGSATTTIVRPVRPATGRRLRAGAGAAPAPLDSPRRSYGYESSLSTECFRRALANGQVGNGDGHPGATH
jgi:hypothetical protein